MKHILSGAAGAFAVVVAVAALVLGAAYAGGSLPLLNGDVDCSGSVGPVDSLKILRFDAGLSNSQALGCAPIGDPGSGNPPTSTPQPTPEPTPAGPATTFGSGAHIVGTDIAAGTYRNSDSSGGCFWERLSGFGGTFDDIIANGFADYLQIVTIKATDAGFSSDRCGTWSPAAGAITSSPTAPFSDGMYFVGTDIGTGDLAQRSLL